MLVRYKAIADNYQKAIDEGVNTSLIVNYIKLCLATSKYISCTYWYFILSGGCEIN